jgi:hypothetical protein
MIREIWLTEDQYKTLLNLIKGSIDEVHDTKMEAIDVVDMEKATTVENLIWVCKWHKELVGLEFAVKLNRVVQEGSNE